MLSDVNEQKQILFRPLAEPTFPSVRRFPRESEEI